MPYASEVPDDTAVLVIHPGSVPWRDWLDEAWRTRRIAGLLALRSLKARYKQTLLGAGWAVLQPLLLMLVFWAFFGIMLKVPTGEMPYPAFAFTGLVLWQFFGRAVSDASLSIVGQGGLVTKVYFPRLHLPVSSLLVAGVDLLAALACLFLMLLLLGIVPGGRVLVMPAFLLLLLLTGAGAALLLASLNVRFRDVGQLLPFAVQLLMFLSPVIYPSNLVPTDFRFVYGLNPLVTVIDGARWALLDGPSLDAGAAALSVLLALTLFLGGLALLRRLDPDIPDLI